MAKNRTGRKRSRIGQRKVKEPCINCMELDYCDQGLCPECLTIEASYRVSHQPLHTALEDLDTIDKRIGDAEDAIVDAILLSRTKLGKYSYIETFLDIDENYIVTRMTTMMPKDDFNRCYAELKHQGEPPKEFAGVAYGLAGKEIDQRKLTGPGIGFEPRGKK